MILKRYGNTLHSVELDFDSKALTEIAFRRDRKVSIPVEEFESSHARVEIREFAATREGWVQDEVEQDLLDELEEGVRELIDGLEEDQVVLVESEQGVDYPKTRSVQKNRVVEGENRLHFTIRVEPPLRLGVYREEG